MAKKNKDLVSMPGQLNMLEELGQKTVSELTSEQEEFIFFDEKTSVILAATAGSGKTFSSVQRLKTLVDRGVDPNKIIFFSFTTAATDELRERVGRSGIKTREKISGKNEDGVTITTIHSFANSLLARMGKYKDIAQFNDFLRWFKKEYRPSSHASKERKEGYHELISSMYEESNKISSAISSFKLQSADNIKVPVPPFLSDYNRFLRETRSRDFSDMLIEVRDLLRDNKWLKRFRNAYDYIFIDEYQDTSTIQMQILLSLNAGSYYLIGDRNQSIYGYSGANCSKLESMLKKRRGTIEMSLSRNFRSLPIIVENSNKFSTLQATADKKGEGVISDKILVNIDDLIEVFKQQREVVALVRTNNVIRKLEVEMLKRKVPMRYFNFITEDDVSKFKKGNVDAYLRGKLNTFKGYFENDSQLISFIESFKRSPKHITSIHKSKGREFDVCVVVNSLPPSLLKEKGVYDKIGKKMLERISFTDEEKDEESKKIHYVAVSRPKEELHYMIYE